MRTTHLCKLSLVVCLKLQSNNLHHLLQNFLPTHGLPIPGISIHVNGLPILGISIQGFNYKLKTFQKKKTMVCYSAHPFLIIKLTNKLPNLQTCGSVVTPNPHHSGSIMSTPLSKRIVTRSKDMMQQISNKALSLFTMW